MSFEYAPFRFLRNLARSREIAGVLLSHGFDDLLERIGLKRYLQWGKRLFVKRQPGTEGQGTPFRIRRTLEDLGPTFIKFGQVISTRPDLVPEEVINELELLQERVPPFPGEQARQLVERELKHSITELFAEFETEPLAAGSLGQVHRAVSFDGTPLVVKVRRPNAERDVERDLSLMQEIAGLIERNIPESQVFDPIGLVAHFTRTIRREVNFLREARTMEQFRRLYRDDPDLMIPRIYPELCTPAVLTMEFVDGYRPDDLVHVREAGLSPPQLAASGARLFLKQVFDLGIFHGDPHPGNIRILRSGKIALLDYGMIGFIDDEKREMLVDLIVAVAKSDVSLAVRVVQGLGQPSRPIDPALLRIDIQDFVETYYGVPLAQLRVGRMLGDFVQILSSHGLRCPGDLMLLIRATVTLEGVGRGLDPSFNLATELAPFVETLVKRRYDPRRIAGKVAEDVRELLRTLHSMPVSLARTLDKLSRDDLKIQLEHRSLDHLISEFDRSSNRVVVALVVAALVVSSSLIIRSSGASPWITIPVFALSGMLGIWLIYGVLRSGRL
ncbi:MAG: AarF/ABC1/UbiB kinase family protein [Planctomycetota bacterium]|nr:MAG: AarF/ABC1/UbiB kinase family protein [Planctomycetota bacterium]